MQLIEWQSFGHCSLRFETRYKMKHFLVVTALLSLAAVPVLASEATFERNLSINGRVELTVATGSGNIHLTHGSGNQIHIYGKVKSNCFIGWEINAKAQRREGKMMQCVWLDKIFGQEQSQGREQACFLSIFRSWRPAARDGMA